MPYRSIFRLWCTTGPLRTGTPCSGPTSKKMPANEPSLYRSLVVVEKMERGA